MPSGSLTKTRRERSKTIKIEFCIEVLSKSTQEYDQTNKFRLYRSLPDLQEYVLINQNHVEIHQYTKAEGGFWLFRAYESEAETVKFTSIDLEVTVADIYQGVRFAAANP
jgi:Uma2 family endonuclease